MRIVAVAVVVVLALSGCIRTSPEVDTAPTVQCLTVNAESLDALRVGVKAIQDSNDVARAAAFKIPDSSSWFVAAEVTGPGMASQTGVWVTVNDPTSSPSNAYQSVDGIASNFSDYVQSPTYSSSSYGVDEAKSCL